MELSLDSPVQYLPKVGPTMASRLNVIGIDTVYDLLTYIPFRYNDYSLVSPIARVQPGETVTVTGVLRSISTFVTKNGKRMQTAKVQDESGTIDVIWFNQPYLVKTLHVGDTLRLSGNVNWFGKAIVFQAPEYEILASAADGEQSLHTGRLVPVYSVTDGLSPKWLRGRIDFALKSYLPLVEERLPESIIAKEHLMGIRDAISAIHFPDSDLDAARAKERLAFDELFFLILRSYERKRLWETEYTAPKLPLTPADRDAFTASLPFTLTPDQQTAIGDIIGDIARSVPMNRLLEGDVGSGKTVVAAAAMFAAVKNGTHAILMAPTQILAEQHAATLRMILETKHGIPVHLIIGGTKQGASLPHHTTPQVFVGTHALLTSDLVPTDHIGCVAIDEQQRFGVKQRATLRDNLRGTHVPHQLLMTATPIPRTIAQTVFGNLDISVLHTLPSGRLPVKTWVVPKIKRQRAYEWIRKELKGTDAQAFIVCPLIEESESLSTVKAASAEYERLKKTVFSDLSVALLHGRMKQQEKTDILAKFRDHTYQILVSTPVVEVGIDIPDATIMLIEAAERFGLSQLHQLRGRVGRSDKPSYCLLFTETETPEVLPRLKSLETTHNGPDLAEIDFALRGPGDLFGTRQHGLPALTVARLTDTAMVARAKAAVRDITAGDPELVRFPHLRQRVKRDTIDEA